MSAAGSSTGLANGSARGGEERAQGTFDPAVERTEIKDGGEHSCMTFNVRHVDLRSRGDVQVEAQAVS